MQMNTIQELKDPRDQLTLEVESIRLDLAPFEVAQESPEVIQHSVHWKRRKAICMAKRSLSCTVPIIRPNLRNQIPVGVGQAFTNTSG
jgi:hypothetical protein